jgi:hypothetical protein
MHLETKSDALIRVRFISTTPEHAYLNSSLSGRHLAFFVAALLVEGISLAQSKETDSQIRMQ